LHPQGIGFGRRPELTGKTQRHKGNKKIPILHSYLKEKNALQEKSRAIIFYNLGALVPWWQDT